MRVAVLGCGYHGRGVAYQLGAVEEVSSLVVADKDEKAALRVRDKIGGKAVAQWLDVTDRDAVARILEGIDVVFNAIGPYYKHALGVIQVAIDHQVNYVDLNDDGDVYEELFLKTDYDVRAKEAGVTVLCGAGVCPGVTNVLAKYGSQQLEKVKAIHIRGGFSYIRGVWGGWDHLLHSLDGEITQFLGSKYVRVKAGEGKELVKFLDPIGSHEVYYFGHSEPITLPRYIAGLGESTTKVFVYQPKANVLLSNLVKCGFANSEPVAGLAETPVEYITRYMASLEGAPYFEMETCDWPMVLQVEVIGEKGGHEVHLIYELHDTARRSVTAAGAVATESVIRGEISAKGVLSLEGCVDPEHFLSKIVSVPGVTIYERRKEEVLSQLRL